MNWKWTLNVNVNILWILHQNFEFNFSIEKVVEILTRGRNIFNLENPKIDIGANACMTFFDPSKRDIFTVDNIISTSKNCAFIDMDIVGVVYGCINENKICYPLNWVKNFDIKFISQIKLKMI